MTNLVNVYTDGQDRNTDPMISKMTCLVFTLADRNTDLTISRITCLVLQ